MNADLKMSLLLLPENIFNTLTQKIYGKFPRPSAINRQHAAILLRYGMIEICEMGLAPKDQGDSGAHKILVPTLACQNAMIKLGLVKPGDKQNV
jgi:hypothetical protein